MREEGFFYACEGNAQEQCDFKIWKEKQGRYLDHHTRGRPFFATAKQNRWQVSSRVTGSPTRHAWPWIRKARCRFYRQKRESLKTRITSRIRHLWALVPFAKKARSWSLPRGYVCTEAAEEGCPFKLPLRLCQRRISREEASRYASDGRTEVLEGFISRRGSPFSASLVLGEKGKIQWEFPPRGKGSRPGEKPDDGPIVDEDPLGPCPVCKKGTVLTTANNYVCRNGETDCPFRLPREVLSRTMSREEATEYVQEGQTTVLEGFISRRNRPFSASLYLKKNGKHGYKFPPREG